MNSEDPNNRQQQQNGSSGTNPKIHHEQLLGSAFGFGQQEHNILDAARLGLVEVIMQRLSEGADVNICGFSVKRKF